MKTLLTFIMAISLSLSCFATIDHGFISSVSKKLEFRGSIENLNQDVKEFLITNKEELSNEINQKHGNGEDTKSQIISLMLTSSVIENRFNDHFIEEEVLEQNFSLEVKIEGFFEDSYFANYNPNDFGQDEVQIKIVKMKVISSKEQINYIIFE